MLPNKLSNFYDWTPTCKLSYGDFLRAKNFEDANLFAIDNHNKELIATNQQLSERGIEVVSVSMEREYTILSRNAAQVTEAVPQSGEEQSGSLNWGFSEVLISQGPMNIPLDELVKLTKPASQSWACEQFEIARDEFRRQLYKEALQSATRAIEGQGIHAGIKTEFRFHFLVGIIRLGSFSNSSAEVVSPQLAQQAFLAAAKFAASAYPADPGLSLICAGRAAFVDGDIDSAVAHTRKGMNYLPLHAAGMYQLGRALYLKGERKEAAERLTDAMLLNVEQALSASGDADLTSKMDFLNGVLRQVYERYEARYRQVAERFRRGRQALLNFSFQDVPADALQLKGFVEIQKIPKAAETLAETKTFFAYSAAINQLLGGFRLFPACFEEFKSHCVRQLQEKTLQPPRRENVQFSNLAENSNSNRSSYKLLLASGLISGITVFLLQSSKTPQSINQGILESMSDFFLIPLLFAVGVGGVVALLENLYREYLRAQYKSALAAYEAALYAYNNSKNLLEKEIASIQGLHLPMECSPPSLATVAKQAVPVDLPAERKHASAWSKL